MRRALSRVRSTIFRGSSSMSAAPLSMELPKSVFLLLIRADGVVGPPHSTHHVGCTQRAPAVQPSKETCRASTAQYRARKPPPFATAEQSSKLTRSIRMRFSEAPAARSHPNSPPAYSWLEHATNRTCACDNAVVVLSSFQWACTRDGFYEHARRSAIWSLARASVMVNSATGQEAVVRT